MKGGAGVPVSGAEVDDMLPDEPRGELKLMTPNPDVVYTVNFNGKYLKCL
ncbi:protein of unknown function [Methanocaldococcus lauensis]|uniref:Uncharacterized protein n=1 Tax=Methanocaldococcus lauensis TaxID=2546128 RepID=A0A8D6PRP5_9EURY|nr:protein of unknown function [Methanocaldococcus lauensis]